MAVAGALTDAEARAFAAALQWHGLDPSTPLHLAPNGIVDSTVNRRISDTLAGSSPSTLQRAFDMLKPLMLAHSEIEHTAAMRRQASTAAAERKRRAAFAGAIIVKKESA